MASKVSGTEQNTETGEIPESDCKMPASATSRSPLQKQHDSSNPARSAPSSISHSTTSIPYQTVKSVDSIDESFPDTDEDSGLWKPKRQKCSNLPPVKPELFKVAPNPHKQIPVGAKKINNTWGEVLQKRNQGNMAKECRILWMDGSLDRSRASETCNYGPIKLTLGPRQEMNYKGRYEIMEDDPEEKVADEIAFRLQEPKKDLIARIVKIIGKKKSIELLMETAEVEQNGGLLIMDGSRRRTPGGVYIYLLKRTPCITSEQIKEIFYIENQKEYENKCAAKKRRLQEYDDDSQEIDGLELLKEIGK